MISKHRCTYLVWRGRYYQSCLKSAGHNEGTRCLKHQGLVNSEYTKDSYGAYLKRITIKRRKRN
jgi:hypothetical protein